MKSRCANLVVNFQGSRAKPKRTKRSKPAVAKATAVYITNLPLDTTVDELEFTFSKYGGIIAEDLKTGGPRIKLYKDEQGNVKGDAFIQFHRQESVDQAIGLLDETDFRLGKPQEVKMRVQQADYSYKKENQPSVPGQKPAPFHGSKKLLMSKQKLNRSVRSFYTLDTLLIASSKLADWSDDEPATKKPSNSRYDKTVFLKHMFTLQELQVIVTQSRTKPSIDAR
jgi:HIV Tat-specific factor 1